MYNPICIHGALVSCGAILSVRSAKDIAVSCGSSAEMLGAESGERNGSSLNLHRLFRLAPRPSFGLQFGFGLCLSIFIDDESLGAVAVEPLYCSMRVCNSIPTS